MNKSIKNTLSYVSIVVLLIAFALIGVKFINKDYKPVETDFAAETELQTEPEVTSPEIDSAAETEPPTEPETTSPETDMAAETEPQTETERETKTTPPETVETSAAANNSNGDSVFTSVPPEYFDDALFIGDSRTVGLMEYGSIKNATFFASTGMDIYKIYNQKINIGEHGKTDLISLLENNKYSKVYVMLGINELGYNFNTTLKKYNDLIETIKSLQPEAIIYIEANMHVSESRSASDDVFNNDNINDFNSKIAALADNITTFYIDVNPLFDDENGNLRADYTHDDTHVLGKHYKTWTDWIASNAVVK